MNRDSNFFFKQTKPRHCTSVHIYAREALCLGRKRRSFTFGGAMEHDIDLLWGGSCRGDPQIQLFFPLAHHFPTCFFLPQKYPALVPDPANGIFFCNLQLSYPFQFYRTLFFSQVQMPYSIFLFDASLKSNELSFNWLTNTTAVMAKGTSPKYNPPDSAVDFGRIRPNSGRIAGFFGICEWITWKSMPAPKALAIWPPGKA